MNRVIMKEETRNLRTKIINILMKNGKKNTGEKSLLKFAKRLQKSSDKHFKNLVQVAIINTTPTFKINEQIVKRGKRKTVRSTPSFITSNSLRIMNALKLFKRAVEKNKNSNQFYENFVNEVLSAASSRGQSVDKKTELQKQVVANKRYLSNFRW
jgi:ribosomal protein S7